MEISHDPNEPGSALRAVFSTRPNIIAALLFGSRARQGQPRFDSDFDVAVLAVSPLTSEQRFDLIQSISGVVGTPVDLIDLNVEHGFVARDAIVEGKILYCRDPDAFAERVRRLVYDAEDFLPALRQGSKEAIRQCLKTSFAAR